MADSLCQVCKGRVTRYNCPRCKISFCSVACYQSETHLECSEFFYQSWVQDELKNSKSDHEAKQKLIEILKKQQNQDVSDSSLDSDDEKSEPDLASRMVEVNLDDDEDVWKKLTSDERKEFKDLIMTGNIIKILPDWEPWWEIKAKKRLVQELNDNDFDWKSICPTVPDDIPLLTNLTKSVPSPCVAFMVFNVLSSYVFTVRWFKGAHQEMPVEATSTVNALSETLNSNKVFTNFIEAFLSFEDNISKCKWIKNDEYNSNLVHEDLKHIIQFGDLNKDDCYCIKAALSDLNSLFSKTIVTLKDSNTGHLKRFTGTPLKVNHIHQISKKITYYLSWTLNHGYLLKNAV